MSDRKINIGTSGWSYKDWKGIFYPEKLKPAEYLKFYKNFFHTTEINTSFYHMPLQKTVEKWTETVPAGFRFCVKISRYITHLKKLHKPEEPLERFFNVFEPMHKKMGLVLIQLPPSLKFNYDVASHFFHLLKTKYGKYQFALEVRHDTWLQDDSLTLMTKYDLAFVISQSGVNFPYSEMVTSKNIYVRFHGPEKLYASSYSDEMLADFAKKFKQWIKKGHHVWAFFNNDYDGKAIQDGKRLEQLLGIETNCALNRPPILRTICVE